MFVAAIEMAVRRARLPHGEMQLAVGATHQFAFGAVPGAALRGVRRVLPMARQKRPSQQPDERQNGDDEKNQAPHDRIMGRVGGIAAGRGERI